MALILGKYITNDILVSRFVIVKVGECCACYRVFRQDQQGWTGCLVFECSAIFVAAYTISETSEY